MPIGEGAIAIGTATSVGAGSAAGGVVTRAGTLAPAHAASEMVSASRIAVTIAARARLRRTKRPPKQLDAVIASAIAELDRLK